MVGFVDPIFEAELLLKDQVELALQVTVDLLVDRLLVVDDRRHVL